jgi:catechol 2,3-dioxygenase-like lactoylglutathione lyase family enzyme
MVIASRRPRRSLIGVTSTAVVPWSSDNLRSVIPILRMFDLASTRRFYLEYLGFSVVSQVGNEPENPVYLIVELGVARLHLSSFHGDGTPGTAVVVVTRDLDGLHSTLRAKAYPFMNPGIDPASNTLRFYEPS